MSSISYAGKEYKLGIEGLEPGLSDEEAMRLLTLDTLKPLKRRPIEIDPIDYEIGVHRISSLLKEGSYSLLRTSGSPIVTECAEYMLAVYDKDGHLAFGPCGVIAHLVGSEGVVKLLRYWFEDDPGFRSGDQFIVSDPYIGGMHSPDIYVIKPIFVHGKLVAWIASVTHTVENGAMDPGGMPARSTDIFQEGLRLPGLKIVEGDVLSKPVMKLLERSCRNPDLMALDTMAKIAGNNVAHARLNEFIEEKGLEFFERLLCKMIYEAEDKARARIKTIPDGIWRSRVYGDTNGQENKLIRVEVTCEKRGEELWIDLSGTSPQNPGPQNCALPGSIGTFFSVFCSFMLWDVVWNHGILSPFHINIPEGTMYNPCYPAPVAQAPPGAAALLCGAITAVVSRLNMAAGNISEVSASWMANWNGPYMGGIDQFGQPIGTITMDANGSGTGATPFSDGDDTSAFIQAPGALMADVESYEATAPLLYLFRRQKADSGGPGKFRGGLGGEAAVMVHKSPLFVVGFIGLGEYTPSTTGLFGGYPADSCQNAVLIKPSIKDLTTREYGDLLTSIDRFKAAGEFIDAGPLAPPRRMRDGDMYYVKWMGGGGYGDPLKRDPEMVRLDVLNGKISIDAARKVYAVVLDEDTLRVNIEGTAARRKEIIADRRRSWRQGEGKSLAKEEGPGSMEDSHANVRVSDCIAIKQIGEERVMFCTDCGYIICRLTENYKLHCTTIDRNPIEIGHKLIRSDWLLYREYYCPSCATLLDVDPLAQGDNDVWDICIAKSQQLKEG